MKNPKGQIQIYTGDGKGKTTAALGLALRAVGQDKKVAVIFFDKGGLVTGEQNTLKKLGVEFYVTGNQRFKPGKPFRFSILPEDITEAERGLQLAKKLLTKNIDILILDEIISAVTYKMLANQTVLELLNHKPTTTELILTGRGASSELIAAADLVTEMQPLKHYINKGVPARKGIEF